MITLVLDPDGNTLHDCTALGCTVSWDGIAIGASVVTKPSGNVTPIDANVWKVRGNTAQLIQQAAA